MPELPPRIRALLWEHTTLVMATARADRPWIASVFYAPEEHDGGLQLVCALLATSRKLANLRANPHAAVYVGPREPTRWLQAAGAAAVLDAAAAGDALARLTAHAPAARIFIDRVPVVPVILTIESVRLTDLTGARPPFEEWQTSPPETLPPNPARPGLRPTGRTPFPAREGEDRAVPGAQP